MSSNSTRAIPMPRCGENHIDRQVKLKAFDLLPRQIRQALAEAHSNYCPSCVLKGYHRVGSIGAVLVAIKDANITYAKAYRDLLERGL